MLHNLISGKPIDLSRNVMVTKALQDKCEYIFFLDSDILVNSDTLQKLFIGNLPIISAVYYSRAPPYEMVAQIGGRGLSHEMAGEDQVREVEEVGMGCCLVNTRVFHRVGKNWIGSACCPMVREKNPTIWNTTEPSRSTLLVTS
jgi:hypothetical protein